MIAVQCQSCGRITGAKRALGFGTYFMVVITLGLWLLAIPFYPLRCVVCGEDHGRPGLRNFVIALAAILAVGVVGAAIRDAVTDRKEPVTIINAYEARETDSASKQPRRFPRMTLNYTNRSVTYSENDTATVTPAQLIANRKGYLNHKIILSDAKLTDKLGKSGPCDAILLFRNGTIAACIPEQSEATEALRVGENVDMACVVNNVAASDPRVVLRDCLLIPTTGFNTSQEVASAQDQQLNVVPNLFGTGAISDGRTYSIALITRYNLPPGTELFAQGIILGQVGPNSIVLGDEQDREKRLVCTMSPEESGEVMYLYHTEDRVQVYGVSSGPYDVQGSPHLVLQKCRVASPTDNVVR